METFQLLGTHSTDGCTNEEFQATFNVSNITSDIFVLIKEGYSVSSTSNIIGRIVIPISQYLGPSGPTPAKLQWFQIYPTSNTNVCTKYYIIVWYMA
jgi:hypothetical protein